MEQNASAAALFEYSCLKNDKGEQVSKKLEEFIKKTPKDVDYKKFFKDAFYGVSFRDKQFLNEQFSKYGKYFVGKLLETVYQLHIDELLPEILVSIRNSFRDAKVESSKFARDIQEQKSIVNMVILKSFVQYSDMIKNNQELTIAYQDILELLIDLNYEEAAVILDEFRVH